MMPPDAAAGPAIPRPRRPVRPQRGGVRQHPWGGGASCGITPGVATLAWPGCCASWKRRPAHVRVDLPDGTRHGCDIDPFAGYCLPDGVDEISFTLAHEAKIAAFENRIGRGNRT